MGSRGLYAKILFPGALPPIAAKGHLRLQFEHFEQLIEPELAGLDEELSRILGTDHPLLAKMARRILAAPGKRLRPKLLVLCARMLDYEAQDAITYAAVFELIHTATLLHDDIIDDAKTRRGQATMNAEYDNTLTVLYGDLLYTKSHTRAIEAGRLDVLHTVDWVSERMIEGELLQHSHIFDLNIDEPTYFTILERKTAYLFAGTTKTAGLLAQRSEAEIDALYQYGFQLGVAFQIMDDLLDYIGEAAQMGKPVLSDLAEGKVTLPLIRLLAKDPELVRPLVERTWREHQVPDELVRMLRESDGIAYTFEHARAASERAVAHLSIFPDNAFASVLRALPVLLLDRRK